MSADGDPMISGMTLAEWREMPWWPNATEARVSAGTAGHDHEIVVNLDGYDFRHAIEEPVFDALMAVLPAHWYGQNRDTRIELHPSGRFAGGYTEADVELVRAALPRVGLVVGVV